MKNEKCFLNHCSATLGDCLNPSCRCLICLGQKQDDCEILQDEHKLKLQQTVCECCKNHIDNQR